MNVECPQPVGQGYKDVLMLYLATFNTERTMKNAFFLVNNYHFSTFACLFPCVKINYRIFYIF